MKIANKKSNRKCKHGYYGTRTYSSWISMIGRVERAKHPANHIYKNKIIDPRWREDFMNFLNDMGVRPDGKTLDRIDNEKGYCKENCRWATPYEQTMNSRAVNLITWNGETKSQKEWAEYICMPKTTFGLWVKNGMGIDAIMKKWQNLLERRSQIRLSSS